MLTADRRDSERSAGSVLLVGPRAMSVSRQNAAEVQRRPDAASLAWLSRLGSDGPARDEAVGELHELLLRAARFEISRRRAATPHLHGRDYDDLAQQSADDALLAILAKLDDFRGESRFTTWAYKFALLEAATKLRRRAWQSREISLEPEHWDLIDDHRPAPDESAEARDLIRAARDAIRTKLTPHQREILLALTVSDIPIDVLAERLNTTRGALYKTLHDARRKLREELSAQGFDVASTRDSEAT
jgi:RNA polymerase sigma-70 factor (ECF subfamily)